VQIVRKGAADERPGVQPVYEITRLDNIRLAAKREQQLANVTVTVKTTIPKV
jgi:hypothetical protein